MPVQSYDPDLLQIISDADSALSAMNITNPTADQRIMMVQNVILLNQPKWLAGVLEQITLQVHQVVITP